MSIRKVSPVRLKARTQFLNSLRAKRNNIMPELLEQSDKNAFLLSHQNKTLDTTTQSDFISKAEKFFSASLDIIRQK
jgi:hypothetical protein